jgi:hypothetical protein
MAGLLDKLRAARAQGEGPQPHPSSPDISDDERGQLMAQIETAVARAPTDMRIRRDYTPQRSGLAFPLAVNIAAAVLIALAAVLLPLYFNRQQSVMTGGAGSMLSGESSLVSAMKREAEGELKGKDAEIGRIQDALARAAKERDELRVNASAQVQKKEQELQAAFDARLAAETARLQGAGLAPADRDRQLAALRTQLRATSADELASYRAGVEADLARKQEALDARLAETRQGLARVEAEKTRLQAQLASSAQEATRAQGENAALTARLSALTNQSEREQLALDQVTASFAAVVSAIRASRLDDARAALSALASFLNQPGVASLDVMKRNRPVNLFLVDSLTQQIAARAAPPPSEAPQTPALTAEQSAALARLSSLSPALAAADARYAAGDWGGALEKYSAALALLGGDAPGMMKATANISDAGFRQRQAESLARADRPAQPAVKAAEELARRGNTADAIAAYLDVLRSWPGSTFAPRSLAGIASSIDTLLRKKDEDWARRDEARKTAVTDAIATLGAALSTAARSADATSSAAQKELISLLDAKVKVKSILGSDPVAQQYPGLADALERYLQLYGEERKTEGRTAALNDVATVLDVLAGNRAKDALASLWSRYGDAEGRAAFKRLLDRLQQVFR